MARTDKEIVTDILKAFRIDVNSVKVSDDSINTLTYLFDELLAGSITNGTLVYVDYIATEIISKFDVVTADGKVANSSLYNQRNKIIGISITDTNIGFAGQAIGYGEIQNSAWTWLIGDKIFLNGTALSTTPASSGFSVLIGVAIKTDTIKIEIQPSILL